MRCEERLSFFVNFIESTVHLLHTHSGLRRSLSPFSGLRWWSVNSRSAILVCHSSLFCQLHTHWSIYPCSYQLAICPFTMVSRKSYSDLDLDLLVGMFIFTEKNICCVLHQGSFRPGHLCSTTRLHLLWCSLIYNTFAYTNVVHVEYCHIRILAILRFQ